MSQFHLQHPTHPEFTALYGRDNSLGVFVHIFRAEDSDVEYDRRLPWYRGVEGVAALLVDHGFLEQESLEVAQDGLLILGLDELGPEAVRLAAEVLTNLGPSP